MRAFVWIMVHLYMCLFACMLFTCIVCMCVCVNVKKYDIDMDSHTHTRAFVTHINNRTHIHTDRLHEWPLMRVCVWIVVYLHMCFFARMLCTCIVYGASVSMYGCVIQIHTRIHTYTVWYTYTHIHTSIQTRLHERPLMCVFVWIMAHVHMCLFPCMLYTCIGCMRVCVNVYMYDINMCTHIHIDAHLWHTYSHVHTSIQTDYMSGHSCVWVYELWYVYTCVSSHVRCVRVLRRVRLCLYEDI